MPLTFHHHKRKSIYFCLAISIISATSWIASYYLHADKNWFDIRQAMITSTALYIVQFIILKRSSYFSNIPKILFAASTLYLPTYIAGAAAIFFRILGAAGV